MRNHLLHILLLTLWVLPTACTPQADRTVCFFGSSVCKGVGADSLCGYADLVAARLPKGWKAVNISESGNNTYDLLARYASDLLPVKAKYVVIGLSLGNEGLHEKGERALLSYNENMTRLIRQLQQDGRVVIVTNNYPRADYNAVDYNDLCTENLAMQQWQVTSVNLCGTIDDGQGHWANAYWDGKDIYPPNTRGHQALASAFPVSLWQALAADKPLPQYLSTAGDTSGIQRLQFVPEAGVESYTLSYQSNDTTYTTVYSGCQQRLRCYINGICVRTADNHTEPIDTFTVIGQDLHRLLFYRAAMTDREVQTLAAGTLLLSSLELYCPLLHGNTANYAQTMNTIQLTNSFINN